MSEKVRPVPGKRVAPRCSVNSTSTWNGEKLDHELLQTKLCSMSSDPHDVLVDHSCAAPCRRKFDRPPRSPPLTTSLRIWCRWERGGVHNVPTRTLVLGHMVFHSTVALNHGHLNQPLLNGQVVGLLRPPVFRRPPLVTVYLVKKRRFYFCS